MEQDHNRLKTKSQLIHELDISQAMIAALLEEASNTKIQQRLTQQQLAIQMGVAQILSTSTSATPTDITITAVIQLICETLGWHFGAFWQVESENLTLHCLATWHTRPGPGRVFKEASAQLDFTLGSDLPGQVLESSRPLWIVDINNDSNLPRAPFAIKEGLKSAFGFPVLFEDRVLGVLEFFMGIVPTPDEKLLEVLGGVGTQVGGLLERQAAEEELRAHGEKFRLFMENIQEVFWMTDVTRNQMIYISPSYETIWGRTCESLYQRPSSYLEAIHPDDHKRIEAALVKQLRGEYAEEYRIVRPDGSVRWIRDRAFPIRNEEGEVYRLTGIASDITHWFQTQEGIYKALIEAKEVNELKSSLMAMASHEFRAPLTVVLTAAEMLEHYSTQLGEEEKLTLLQRIQTSVINMTGLLDDILLVGQGEAGKLKFQPQLLNVTRFCQQLVEELQIGVGAETPSIKFVSPEAEIWAQLDQKLLRQILLNLLSNALKYSSDSEQTPVYFELVSQNEAVIIQIKDRGIGIPLPDQARLFETFFRASNVGAVAGTGLGLTIVKRGVDLHGGRITMESQPGQGTTFWVSLPVAINQAENNLPGKGDLTIFLPEPFNS